LSESVYDHRMKGPAFQHSDAFKAIFEFATIAILLVDETGCITLTNPHTDKLFGYIPEELIGQRIEVLIPEPSRHKHQNLVKGYFDHPEHRALGVGLELSARKKDGSIFPVEISLGYYHAVPRQMAIVFLSDITHRKRAELAVQEDEKRFRDIIQSISDAFMGFTDDWRYLYLNDKALNILGKSRKEVIGKTIWEVFPSALGTSFEKEFNDRLPKKMIPFSIKSRYGLTWWQVRVARYNGGMAFSCTDITDAMNAFEVQNALEEQFSVIFEASPAAISISELETALLIDSNQSYMSMFGYSKEELIGKAEVEIGLFKSKDARNQIIDSIRKNGQLRNFETTAYTKKGNLIHLLVAADIIHLSENEYLLVTITDVSSNKIAMEELQRSEERFSKSFRASPVALVISTLKDGKIIEVNNSFLDLYGFQLEEVIGKTAGELKLYPDVNDRERIIAQLREQGYIRNKELVCFTKNNTRIDVIFSMETIELRGELCVITTALDITDKKKAESKLKLYTDLLEQKVTERTLELTHALEREKEVGDMKSRFVSIASHEFRTPLSTILSSTYLLEQSCDMETDRAKHFNRIRAAVKNLTFILTEFLSLDKLEQRKVIVENELFDIDNLATEVIDEVKIAYRLSFPIEYVHSGLRLIHQDKSIIKNLLLNLVSNAVKYSPSDKIIKLQTKATHQSLTIHVIDNGMGIPQEDQKFIFTKFFRGRNASHIHGTGLGLNIVKRYVELLNGTIDFKSSLNEGTEFEIVLPLHEVTVIHKQESLPSAMQQT
jgi:PAS domain S-box-containing protein